MSKRERSLYLAIGVIGITLSAWLLYHHVAVRTAGQSAPSFCSLNSFLDCDKVARSDFSELFGVPVASFGLMYFIALFLFAARFPVERQYHSVALLLGACALPLTVFEMVVSLTVLQALCLLCGGIYLTVFLFVGFSIKNNPHGILPGLTRGAKELITVIKDAFRTQPIPSSLFPVLTAGMVLLAPEVIRQSIPIPPRPAHRGEDPLTVWRNTPTVSLTLQPDATPEERDYALGDMGAAEVVIFSDFECAYCRKAALLFHELKERYPLRIVYKNFPLDMRCNSLLQQQHHELACRVAEMARCAGEQGERLFWAFHDSVFHLPAITEEALQSIWGDMGLDPSVMERCLEKPETLAKIKRDISEGAALQIQGTPAVYLNGRELPALSREVVEQILKEEGITPLR